MASEHLPALDELIREFGEKFTYQLDELARIAALIELMARLYAARVKKGGGYAE